MIRNISTPILMLLIFKLSMNDSVPGIKKVWFRIAI